MPAPVCALRKHPGGKDNFAADREAAEQVVATHTRRPGQRPRATGPSSGRAVRYLAAEAGIRQFLDIGTGLPTARATPTRSPSEVAPDSRIVYVDNDPIVLLHARALLTSRPQGATAYVQSDLSDTGKVLAGAAETLDLSRPVAVMLLMVLQYIPDRDDPAAIVARLMAAVPPGSYLAIAHPASDVATGRVTRSMGEYNKQAAASVTARSYAEVCRFFAGGGPGSSPASSSCTGGGPEPQRWARAAS